MLTLVHENRDSVRLFSNRSENYPSFIESNPKMQRKRRRKLKFKLRKYFLKQSHQILQASPVVRKQVKFLMQILTYSFSFKRAIYNQNKSTLQFSDFYALLVNKNVTLMISICRIFIKRS